MKEQVLIGDESAGCVLVDTNGNGTFDDTAEDFNADRILLGNHRTDGSILLAAIWIIKGRCIGFRLHATERLCLLPLCPTSPLGSWQIPESVTKFSAGGVNGMYDKTPKTGTYACRKGRIGCINGRLLAKTRGGIGPCGEQFSASREFYGQPPIHR